MVAVFLDRHDPTTRRSYWLDKADLFEQQMVAARDEVLYTVARDSRRRALWNWITAAPIPK